jgi:hypothetical protein
MNGIKENMGSGNENSGFSVGDSMHTKQSHYVINSD